jgi:hypothetical protein
VQREVRSSVPSAATPDVVWPSAPRWGGELPVPSAAAPHAPKELATDGSHTADMEKGSDS